MTTISPNINNFLCPLCNKTPGEISLEDPETDFLYMKCISCKQYIKYDSTKDKWVGFDYQKYESEEAERKLKAKIANKSTEAREWLANTLSPNPLAANRFKDLMEAQVFVQNLYNIGAQQIDVGDVEEPTPGHRYTDTLVVKMPNDKDARREIFKIYNEDSQDKTPDTGQTTLTFWWD